LGLREAAWVAGRLGIEAAKGARHRRQQWCRRQRSGARVRGKEGLLNSAHVLGRRSRPTHTLATGVNAWAGEAVALCLAYSGDAVGRAAWSARHHPCTRGAKGEGRDGGVTEAGPLCTCGGACPLASRPIPRRTAWTVRVGVRRVLVVSQFGLALYDTHFLQLL
jgi:hypothetical protein